MNKQSQKDTIFCLHQKPIIPSFVTFNEDIANVVGIKEAIVIRIIDDECRLNRKIGECSYGGHRWGVFSYHQIANQYYFMRKGQTVEEIILNLESSNVLFSMSVEEEENKQYEDDNNKKWSERRWYRVNHDLLHLLILQHGF